MELRTVGQVYEREPFGVDARQLLAQNFELGRATCVIWTRRVAALVREVEDRRRGSFKLAPQPIRELIRLGINDSHLAQALGAYGDVGKADLQWVRKFLVGR